VADASSLWGGTDVARLMFGGNARHVPTWMYVQRQGPGVVGLVGASRVPEGMPHPLLSLYDIELCEGPGGNDARHELEVAARALRNVRRIAQIRQEIAW
jgi:hypothetical protein